MASHQEEEANVLGTQVAGGVLLIEYTQDGPGGSGSDTSDGSGDEEEWVKPEDPHPMEPRT